MEIEVTKKEAIGIFKMRHYAGSKKLRYFYIMIAGLAAAFAMLVTLSGTAQYASVGVWLLTCVPIAVHGRKRDKDAKEYALSQIESIK